MHHNILETVSCPVSILAIQLWWMRRMFCSTSTSCCQIFYTAGLSQSAMSHTWHVEQLYPSHVDKSTNVATRVQTYLSPILVMGTVQDSRHPSIFVLYVVD
jgi:hypothetical protein